MIGQGCRCLPPPDFNKNLCVYASFDADYESVILIYVRLAVIEISAIIGIAYSKTPSLEPFFAVSIEKLGF